MLEKLLLDKRSTIIRKWREVTIGVYPKDTQRFLKKEKDRFSNPVGQTIATDLERLYDELTGGNNLEKIGSSLDNIIRIRAVQDLIPSRAVEFVFQLKDLVRDALGDSRRDSGVEKEMDTFEQKIDQAALMAFDIYARCREKIYEIRVQETRNQVGRLLERANLTVELPGFSPDP